MKKLVFSTLLILSCFMGFAADKPKAKDDSNKISYIAKQHLSQEFKNAEGVEWKVGSEYQKALFKLDGKRITAIYDFQGNYLGATQAVAFEDLPAKAKLEISKRYKDYYFSEALLVVSRPYNSDMNDVGTYWVDMTKEDKSLYLQVSDYSSVTLYKVVNNSDYFAGN